MKDSQLILFAFILLLECAAITTVESNGPMVSITVDGTPPPGFTPRGPNEYRAASGPYNFTCTATGGAGSGNYMYMWTSSSSGSAFETSATSVISRLALHSGDSGIHTCTATRGGGQSGSNSINVTIVGVGMFVVVSSGVTGTWPNNGLVISNDTLNGTRFRFFCRSNSLDRNIGEFIGLDESPVNNNFFMFPTPGNGGELSVRSTMSEDLLAASEQGVYTCRMPLKGGGEREINIGIYPSGFSTKPNITNPLMFTPGSSSSTLTCTSTGSVATTVTFTRDSTTTVGLLRDGESKTFGRVTYQLAQTVTNRSQSTYQNVLTINQPPADIGGSTFTCSVNNAIGTSPASQSLTINVLCPGPVDIDNGMVTFTGFSGGDIATYSCDSGFELIGGANLTCTQVNMSSAAFSPTPPLCKPLCPQPIDIINGMVTLTGTSVGDTATYSCDSGFELIGNVTTRTCTQVDVNSAAFFLTPPFCRPLCSNPADIDYGMVTLTGNSVDDTATYSCESGFELIGDVTTTCIQMGTNSAEFSPAPPICRPLCPDPVNIENGMLTFTGNSVSDTATYSCDSGFELIGDVNITCTQVNMSSPAFLPAPPVCKPLCSDAVDIENGNAALTGTSIGDTATYSCDLGFELIGDATTTCTQMDANSPEFLPAPPVCRPLCPDPVDIDNGNVSFTGNSIGDTATYSCDSGFELIGNMTTTCTQMDGNSAFLPALPVCRPLCPDPVDIDNGDVSFTGNSVGDTATFSCDSGFELNGNMTTTCTQMDGNSAFLPAPPVCRPLCPDPVDIDNGNVSFTGNSIGDTATYSCDIGFELIGNVITTCTLVNTSSAEFSSPFCRQLNVTISVSYNPPPGFTRVPNEYRAASGPVIVTCTANGGTGSISYQWSSDCRNCDFQREMSSMITRGAVHSGDTGTHTCTATTAKGVGNASINFTVKDAGIQVFVGVPSGSFPNNGLVSLNTKHHTYRLRFFCRSDSMERNVGELIGLNGSVIHNNFFGILHPQPGELVVQNIFGTHDPIPSSEQGVYTCRIPLNNEKVREINIGIYLSDTATINITSVIFESGSSSSTLICNSTGSPPTTVTWTVKDGQTITMRDGDSETRNGINYQLKQTVTDRKMSTYSNVLNINSTSGSISEYACTVSNVWTNDTKRSEVRAIIFAIGSETLGGIYNLSCDVTGVTDVPVEYTWSGPGITGMGHDHQQLSLSPVKLDAAGQYTCTATVNSLHLNLATSKNVTIAIPTPVVQVSSDASSGDLYAGSVLTLNCTITIDDQLMSAGNMAVVTSTWMNDSMIISGNGQRITISDATYNGPTNEYISILSFDTLRMSDAGKYTCQANISHSSLFTTDGIGMSNKTIMIKNPTVLLSLTSNTTDLPNVSPHNTFSLTCTATVPDGVISPKTFTWKRRLTGPGSGSDFQMVDNSVSVVIEPDVPNSQSVLTVTEVVDGVYVYQCLVSLAELGVGNSTDSDPITVSAFSLSINIITRGNAIAGESYTLTCTVSVTEGVPDTLIANWSGPGVGMDDVTSGSVSAQTHENGSSFTFNLTFHSLRQSYNGEYICSAHLTIVSLNDTSVTALAVVAPVVTVIGIASPMGFKLVVAGKLFSITCMVNGADDLQARFNFTLIAEGNGTVIHHEEESSDTELIHNFTARASDAGMYICKVTVTSSFLDKPIISNTTLTLTVQIATPVLTVSRNPDASVTLHHGDPLNLTCTIQLDSAVDINVTVTGTLSGQGIQDPSGTVEPIRSREYQIRKTIALLKAARSAVYNCSITVSPDSGVVNVLESKKNCGILNITVELFVAISVSYTPPPDVELGSNEYRAASGPVIVSCIVTGGTGNISYQWTSDCRGCPFNNAASMSIEREAVHSGDTGNHTCMATTAEVEGNANITFTVRGAGIHVFRGIPTGSFVNNSLVSLNSMDMTFRLRFFCRSDSMMEGVGELIGLDGSHVSNSGFFEISHPQPGELSVVNFVTNSTDLTAKEQGVYTCRIPLQSGEMMEISIGIYLSGFTTPPQITSLTFADGSLSSFLTCTSTGSPATNVTWMRDGQPLAINGSTYQLTQAVTDRAESSYENVLTINEELSTVVEHDYSCNVSNINGNASKHLNLTANPLHVAIMQEENPTAGRSFSLNCSLTLPQWAKSLEEPKIEFLNPVRITDDSFIMIESNEEMSNGGVKYVKALKFTTLQICHGGQYECRASFRSQTAENETSLIVKIPPPTVTIIPADNDFMYSAGNSLTLICIISLNGVLMDSATGIIVETTWTGPHGELSLASSDNGRITMSDVTKSDDFTYSSTVVFSPLHMSDTGSYSCDASVRHMLEFILPSDPGSNQVTINVKAPVVTVISIVNQMNGLVVAGKLFSISCMVNGTDDLEASYNFSVTAQRNNTIIKTTDDTHLLHNFTARVSDAGNYICKVTVTSNFLDGPIFSNTTLTLTVQIPTPVLIMSRDPDISVTLHHGDPLNLTCTIELDPAVDINVTVAGTLSGQGIQNPDYDTVLHIPSRVYRIKRTTASLEAARSAVYTCNATVSPGQRVINITSSEKSCRVLNITVDLAVTIIVSYKPPPGVMLGDKEYRAASGPVNASCIAMGGTPTVRYQWSSTCRNCPFQDANPKSHSSVILRAAVHSGDTGIHSCTATDTTGNTGMSSTSFNITGAGIHVFNGVQKGSFLNNELVVSDDSDSNFHLRFFCRSDSMSNNSGELIGLNNRTLTNSRPFSISSPQPGELLVFVDNHTRLTQSHQGVYTCHISMENGDIRKINIGLYPSRFKGGPIVTSVIYRLDNASSNITCNSISSPPTTVTWVLADAMLPPLRDGESVAVAGVKYELKQTVTNRTTSAYASTLTINTTLAGNTTEYRCTVNNTLGGDSKAVGEGTFSISIIPSGTEIAGETYTLTCSITVTEQVMDTLTAHWSGPGVHMDGVTATNLSISTLESFSTFTLDLTFTPLRQSHDGDYTCTATLVAFTDSDISDVDTGVPLVEVHISGGGVAKFGESLTLDCAISGVDNLEEKTILQWRGPSRTILESTSPRLELSTVSFSDAGIYTCTATVSSPYLNKDILENDTASVVVQVPSPDVAVEHDGRSTINAGSVLVLSCTITLDRRVTQNELLIMTNSWRGPHGELENETRITVMEEQGTSGQYFSNVIFNTIHVGDSGNYSCQANVSHPASQFIHQGMNTNVTTITVQAPNLVLSLNSNTTRLPNVHPYNTFSLTCTATVPEGVVSPKTFTWRRRNINTVMPGNVTEVQDNETTQIMNNALDEPVSTSVLTVTETTAGEWYYLCSVFLMKVTNVTNEADSHPIRVTGPASPEPPVDLLTDRVATDSATISWIVSTIAFTPETYVVHYGTSMDTLDSFSDPMMESNFTAINYKIAITLHGLTPNTMYFYRVNSTNTNGSYLSQVANFTTEALASDSFPFPVIVGAAAAAVVIVVFCIVVIAVWRLQKRSRGKVRLKRGPTAIDAMADVELITVVEDTEIDGHDAVLVSTLEDATYRKNIPIALLSDHVSDMRGERDKDFEAEYNSISKAALASHDVSAIPCNQERNRFVNIYPYDFSRVKLKEIEGVEGSDYINASFLDGYTRESEYIAAQGPVPESVGDFWRMIWENKLTTIVMLTKCEERGKRKCEKYWPNDVNQTLEPGHNLVVTLTALLPFVEYEIRMLSVKDPTHPDEPALEVTHFYYLSWPDHGVPTNSASLINFVRRVRKVQPHSTEVPLLVHCSAGVGRTGTFIAIDIEMQTIEAEGVVDVYGCTKKLRTRRVLMVQTLSQYIFIHEALTELIACGETDMIAASLRTTTNRLHQTVEEKKITGFQEQFEVLDQFSPDANIDHSSETNYPDNLQKNRYTSKVAGSLRRVYLKSTGQGASRSDYINANFVDGYRQRGAYIATQGPLASTVKDFWRMIWEHQSKCIVMLCSEQEEGEESCYQYWPNETGSTETQDEIEVTLLSEEKCGSCIIRKLQVLESTTMGDSDPESTTVTQFQLMCWPLNGQPSPPSSLLGVMDDVARVQMGTGNKPITVMCNDGVGRTGAFICLHAQLERLKAEGVVDIFQFIKSARLSRPGLVQNVEQYILCHEVLSDFVDSFETYANFKELV